MDIKTLFPIMKTVNAIALAALCLLFLQCNKDNPAPRGIDFKCVDNPGVCDLTAANGNFAIDLFRQVNSEEPADKNIFISPFSISTALAMTVNGAAGQTRDDMRHTLRTDGLSLENTNISYKTLLHTLPLLDPATKLKLANSIWPKKDYPVLNSFLQTNTAYFNSEILPADFSDPAVIDEVNGWVETHTDGLIKKTLTELDPDVVMLLINAIYFKGTWRTEFEAAKTKAADFFTGAGPVSVQMMHTPESDFPYLANDLFQAVDLPYGDSVYSMSVFLPNEGHNVSEIIDALQPDTWTQWLGAFKTRSVELFLPKFKLEYGKKLKPTLSDMGMGLAFSDGADFSNMVSSSVKIDDVIHKAFVEVDEKGTEAAAVTVVVIVETSVPFVPVVNVNRPFLFVIRDNKTNSILFMGKVVNPGA